MPEEIESGEFKQEDLVDLIEQPAWKTILIDLVKSEKMDPWDIDVGKLADKYLEKINQLEHADLRIPANAILASAILLKMKARTLRLTSLEELEEKAAAEISEEERRLMEEMIPELRSTRKLREGKVSLDALVGGIEAILVQTKKTAYKNHDREIPQFQIPFPEEDIAEKIDSVYKKIKARADSQGLVLFSALLDEKTPLAMVDTFIPLLFLMNKEKVRAWQEQFFGEIFISLMNEEK